MILIIIILTLLCVLLFKNHITEKNTLKIIDAIYLYKIDCIEKDKEPIVDYSDMESYGKTLFRFWDWGCRRILPKEKYKIIKKYIEEV